MEHGEQVHLLLSAPGQPPVSLPTSPWRGWLPSERGPIDPTTAAQGVRLSPVSPRAERALVGAVAHDDVDTLGRLATQGGATQDAARVLSALRLAAIDAPAAIDLLQQLAAAPTEPTEGKVLRKHWSSLSVQVNLAPSVPALVGLGRSAVALLAAELMVETGRVADALALLESLPPRPTVVLARAATLLANGDHARVLEVTAALPGTDDVSALALVARSVAARSQQDIPAAFDAVCEALSDGDRHPAVLAAALEERAHIYSLAGDTVAAHTDLEALAGLTTGQSDVTIPPPSSLRRGDEPTEEDSLERARKRIRRRITGVGAPGTFGGRHHSTYRDEIATMFALGQVDAVEELLLGLLDVVEDEVDELGVALDATFFLTLADLYQDSGRTEDLHALRERYAAADARATRRAAEMAAVTAVDLAKPAVTVDATTGGEVTTDASGERPADEVLAHQLVSVLSGPVAAPADPAGAAGDAAASGDVLAEPAADPEPAEVVSTSADTSTVASVEPPDAAAITGPVEDEPSDAVVEPSRPEAAEAAEPEPEPAAEVDLADLAPERELTPVERAVRGPRVRSL